MNEVLGDVRVVEVSLYVYAGSAGAVLADWGADVIKVEHPSHGDPVRRTAAWGYPSSIDGVSYLWEVVNRGKRSIGVDIAQPEGRELIFGLVDRCDVFLTNFLPAARRRLGIDVADVMARNPRIIYTRASAVGSRGPQAEQGGFDGISYWARSGAAASVTPTGSPWALNMPGPGFGDVQSGMTLAGAIAAALYRREKTGHGVVVDGSLLSQGLWAMQPSIAATSLTRTSTLPEQAHEAAPNPIVNQYRTRDGRFIALAMLEADRYWPGFCIAVDRVDWLADERFEDSAARARNSKECIALLDALFASRTLDEWAAILSQQEGQWDVVRIPGDVLHDEQAIANGFLQEVHHGGGRSLHLVSAPAQFDETAPVLGVAPRHGEHTDEVLAELGLSPERIGELRGRGVVA